MKLDDKKLLDELARRKLSPTLFAYQAGTYPTSMFRALNGESIRFQTARKIADALNMKVSDLVKGEEE